MLVGATRMLEAVVREVVAGEDRPQLANGPSGDPLARLCLATARDGSETGSPAGRRVVRPVESAVNVVEKVDPRAVGGQQAGRLVDRTLEDLRRVAKGDDAATDLAEGALGVGPAFELDPRAGKLLDQVRIGHCGSGVIGERPNQRDLAFVEGIDPARERAHCAECPAAADHRGDDERVDVHLGDEAIRLREVAE